MVLPGNLFSTGGVTHHGGRAGGCSPLRDISRFVESLEKGQSGLQTLEAYEEVADRTANGCVNLTTDGIYTRENSQVLRNDLVGQ